MEIDLNALLFAVTTTTGLFLGWFYSDIVRFFTKDEPR